MTQSTKSHPWIPITLLLADALLFGITDPHKVPSFMLIVAFLLFVASLYYFIRALIRGASWYVVKPAYPRRLASVLTVVVGLLIALQSIGELTGRDILVLLPLVILGYLYVSYGRKQRLSNQ